MTVKPSPVSLVALGPGSAPHTGPSCARNPAPTAPVSPKASAPTLGGGPVCVWTGHGSCRGSWPGSSSHLTQTEGGGVSGKTPRGCQATIFRFHLWLFVFFVVYRPRRDAPANTKRTGATPTYLPLARLGEGGPCQPRCQAPCQTLTPACGVAPVRMYPCGKTPRLRQLTGQRRPARPADRRRTMRPPVVLNRDGLSPLTPGRQGTFWPSRRPCRSGSGESPDGPQTNGGRRSS